MKDYYDILGVSREATDAELKKAFRQLAMKHHPDRNPDNKESEDKFKEINEAYSCLSDQDKRAHYDRFGTSEGMGNGFSNFGAGFGDIFEDVFGDFFGTFTGQRRARPTRGEDLRYDLDITLTEAAFGTEKVLQIPRWVHCAECNGSGAASGKGPVTCSNCKGTGQIRFQQGFFSVAKTCGKCGGQGKIITDPCRKCKGSGKTREVRNIIVKIPPGVDTGSRLRMTGEGELGTHGGPAGDLYIILDVEENPFLKREGMNLYCNVPITFPQAALGAEIDVPTLYGVSKLKIPAGTPSGKAIHLKSKGMPKVGSHSKGDQIVIVNIEVPKSLNKKQKELLEEFSKINSDDIYKSFREKVKNFFSVTK
ncbi:MAG: molecular chaperone DnaJ [Nitrospiraceae bacterium]|nr:molecular chaperone DnaJ [Nitrospiraceae bacterium]